jgi:CheY-like chemotaxis protein
METETLSVSAPPGQLDCRILLVEDDQDHQPLLSLMLRKAGSEVTVAENGQVAIDLTRAAREGNRPFEIIVMDVQMPVLDGLAATRKLRAEGFTKPIVALTARAVSTDRDKCLAAGCDDFLPKPITRAELVRLLAAHLKRSRARSEAAHN